MRDNDGTDLMDVCRKYVEFNAAVMGLASAYKEDEAQLGHEVLKKCRNFAENELGVVSKPSVREEIYKSLLDRG
jgi:hypothetical protein